MKPTKRFRAGLVALAMQFGILVSALAGGPAILHLPIEGVTAENSNQCAKLFAEKFGPILTNWKNGEVKMIKDGPANLVQLRPERGQISLSDVEEALKGSPFSIKRERLEFISIVQLRIEKIADHQKLISTLATLDGKKLHTRIWEDVDENLLITLSGPHLENGKSIPLITYQRLINYFSKNKIKLISISWGNNHHRGATFGARLVAADPYDVLHDVLMQPLRLMQGDAVMKAFAQGDHRYEAGVGDSVGRSDDPFETGKMPRPLQSRLNTCFRCHVMGVSSLVTVQSRNVLRMGASPEAISKATSTKKQNHDS